MHKNLKITLIAVLAVAMLSGISLWYAVSLINPVQLTRLLSASVKEATGRDLNITGPVSLTIIPSIGIEAQDISLSNAVWASEAEMIHLKKLELGIRLLPLLHKKVQISKMNLNGIEVYLQSDGAGKGNWLLAAPLAQGQSAPRAGDVVTSDDGFISIENINITDARISYLGTTGPKQSFEVQRLALSGNGDKTSIQLDMKQARLSLGVRGTVTSIRKILEDWNAAPLKVDLDLSLDLNDKSLLVDGVIEKSPQQLPSFDITMSSKAFDLGPLLAGSAVVTSSSQSLQSANLKAPSSKEAKYFFDDERLPFDVLPSANGKMTLNIVQLDLPDQAPLKNLKALVKLSNEYVKVESVDFQLGNGRAQGMLSLGKFHSPTPVIAMQGFAKGFTLEEMMMDAKSKVRGGPTRFAFDIQSSGISLHQIASRATGKVQISVGQATVASSFLNKGGDFVITVLDAVNPLRKKSNETVLECAVAYLPVNHGLINIADTVGFETDRLDVVLNGSINLNSEAINLNIYPREKSGLTLGVDLANLVKLQGTLQKPSAGINKAAVVNSAVSIGLGFLTGGASILVENAKSIATKSQPCKAALRSWSDIYAGANWQLKQNAAHKEAKERNKDASKESCPEAGDRKTTHQLRDQHQH